MPRAHSSSAFTLIELLVVIAIIALLVGILLPSLAGARDAAKTAKCMTSVRQLAVAATSYAADYRGLYAHGSFDNGNNLGIGRIDKDGWVANFNNGGYCVPGNLLCPTNPARSNQNLNLNRINRNPADNIPWSIADIQQAIANGFNTNYCQSWYMACTATTSLFPTRAPDAKDRRYVQGPLKDSQIQGSAVTSKIPLFGDAAADISSNPDMVILPDGSQTVGAKSLTDGPVRGVIPGFGSVWGRQNYTDFGAAHGRSKSPNTLGGYVTDGCIGFADGHVAIFNDRNRDGQFGYQQGIINGVNTLVYDELEGAVYGGWLNREGLNF